MVMMVTLSGHGGLSHFDLHFTRNISSPSTDTLGVVLLLESLPGELEQVTIGLSTGIVSGGVGRIWKKSGLGRKIWWEQGQNLETIAVHQGYRYCFRITL